MTSINTPHPHTESTCKLSFTHVIQQDAAAPGPSPVHHTSTNPATFKLPVEKPWAAPETWQVFHIDEWQQTWGEEMGKLLFQVTSGHLHPSFILACGRSGYMQVVLNETLRTPRSEGRCEMCNSFQDININLSSVSRVSSSKNHGYRQTFFCVEFSLTSAH